MICTCIFKDWYDEDISFYYPNIVSSFVYPIWALVLFSFIPLFLNQDKASKAQKKSIKQDNRVRKFPKKGVERKKYVQKEKKECQEKWIQKKNSKEKRANKRKNKEKSDQKKEQVARTKRDMILLSRGWDT